MKYALLYRDKYVERIKEGDGREWLPVYRLDEVTGEYTPLVCSYEAERIHKMSATAEKFKQVGTIERRQA
ncbi:MAG: hypothetical protein C0436_00290 [Alphaproteobacteria bacterium]|nr:hypothetical protein [Alphaproteobacteria bacterium]